MRSRLAVAVSLLFLSGAGLGASAQTARSPGERISALVLRGADDGRRVPLILIHGIHGLEPAENRHKVNGYWKNFYAQFGRRDAEFRRRFALYVFQYYTDREPVARVAEEFGAWIDERLSDRPHLILAHSMGGLVAKTYMASYKHRKGRWANASGGETTLGLITLGTPHHGTPAANDGEALRAHAAFGWLNLFKGGNYAYWWLYTGFFSPPFLSSTAPNRSDLRWDNYDGAIPDNDLPGDDINIWLAETNRRFAAYEHRLIAYGGALRPLTLSLAPEAIWSLINERAGVLNHHRNLEISNEILTRGLSYRFDSTDGLVPLKSAASCHPPARIPAKFAVNYLCASPVRVRRFEPGRAIEGEPLPSGTLSIRRRPRGYDHLDLRDDEEVLRYVIDDLKAAIEP